MAKPMMMGEPELFYEPYVDMKNRLRTKIVCLINLAIGEQTYFAYGSSVRSFDDDYNQIVGEDIAIQRAERVVQELKKYDGEIKPVRQWLAECFIPAHIKLFSEGAFNTDLENRLLPFRDGDPVPKTKPKVSYASAPRDLIDDAEHQYGTTLAPLEKEE